MLRRLQAMAALRTHEYERAEDFGQQALEFAVELPNEAGQAWWAIAEARAGAGDPSADDAFRQAIDLLHEHGTVRDYANVLRAYGRYLRESRPRARRTGHLRARRERRLEPPGRPVDGRARPLAASAARVAR